jgi:hypothetical protein
MVCMGEGCCFLDLNTSALETIESRFDVVLVLHREYLHVILFVDPDQQSFVSIEEHSSAFGPVSIEAERFEEAVSCPAKVRLIGILT